MNEATAAVIVFETFGKQDGPRDAKAGGGGEKFRMSKRQRVRGTVVDSCFGETRGNLVSNTVMPPFIPHNLAPLSRLSCISRFVSNVSRFYYPTAKIAKFDLSFSQTRSIPPVLASQNL